jgi:hypothetical protein
MDVDDAAFAASSAALNEDPEANALEADVLLTYFGEKIQEVKETVLAASCSGRLRWDGLRLDDGIDLERVAPYPEAVLAATFLFGMTYVLDLARMAGE